MRNEILEKGHFLNINKIDIPMTKFDNTLEESIIGGVDRSREVYMIYGVNRSKGEEIRFIEESSVKKIQIPMKTMKPRCYECVHKDLCSHFAPKVEQAKVLNKLESENSESHNLNNSLIIIINGMIYSQNPSLLKDLNLSKRI